MNGAKEEKEELNNEMVSPFITLNENRHLENYQKLLLDMIKV